MAELVQEGKVRHPRPLRGGAGHDPARAGRAPDHGAPERVLALDARSRGRGPADGARARDRLRRLQPAGRGFLSGRIRSDRRPGGERLPAPRPALPGGEPAAEPRARREVEELAAEKSATPSQVALAWVLARGEDVVPIPGTKRRSYLEENAAAAAIELSPEDVERSSVRSRSASPQATAIRTCPPSTGDPRGDARRLRSRLRGRARRRARLRHDGGGLSPPAGLPPSRRHASLPGSPWKTVPSSAGRAACSASRSREAQRT
jgi:hypothetical protein